MAKRDPRTLQRWKSIIDQWRNSGQSVTAFCRDIGVHKSGFHNWRNVIEQLEHDQTTASRPKSTTGFVPVRVLADPIVEVILPTGVQLRIPLTADAQQLTRLVQALGGTPC
jgi:transposase-like protein